MTGIATTSSSSPEASASTAISSSTSPNDFLSPLGIALLVIIAAFLVAPHPDELALRNRLLDQLRAISGNVLVLEFPEYGRLAGKPMYAIMDATGAVIEAKKQQQDDRLLAQYQQLIDCQELSSVALDRPAEGLPRPAP